MTTMPPEMSTSTATNPSNVNLNSSRSSTDSLARSRFMITDILAAHQTNNQGNLNLTPQHQHQLAAATQHHPHHHQAALQHYIAQQQHLLQQRHQQTHNGTGISPSSSPPAPAAQHLPPPPPAAAAAAVSSSVPATKHFSPLNHPLAHLPPSALMGFPGAHNGFSAAATAAAHYAALQRDERERERLRDLDAFSYRATSSQNLDPDDRSRSPQPMFLRDGRDLNGQHVPGNAVGAGGVAGSGGLGGGGDSSISGDQASTIDDSDSDCGAKDDDGHSIKSSDNLMGLTKKQRKARTAFTDHQLQTLEKSFERQKYLSVQDRMELANKLELSDCQVKTWYQNRRTKWKRQTAVGLELLAEAGNYAAFQRLYGGSPYLSSWPYAHPPPSHHMSTNSPIDMYYRQAAAAAVLQKPLTYRMYPTVNPMTGSSLGGMPLAPTPMSHLSASNSLQSLSSYYQSATQSFGSTNSPSNHSSLHAKSPTRSEDNETDEHRKSVEIIERSCSPTLNPGSPPERLESKDNNCPPKLNNLKAKSFAASSDTEADDEDDAIEV